ncbi:hypothetical protein QQF64_033922 [Cirrhinus molitorella]|uniref:Uncharacterized protein n=1 Tax=Cirrhinus molitorella TaxID=172907 RepID=A0ABR3MVC2_9TELE
MIASYVDNNHNKWDHFLPETRFAINSAIQETTGVTPAELHLGRKLEGPMDKILHGPNLTPDTTSYDVISHTYNTYNNCNPKLKRVAGEPKIDSFETTTKRQHIQDQRPAEQLEVQANKRLKEIFQETSDEEEFLGF